VGISIGKSRNVPVDNLDAVVADYVESFDAVRTVADFVVVNVSSPNTAGLRSMQSRDHARALLSALADRGGKATRLLLKIAPDLEDAQIEDLLSVVEDVALTGVVATNTTVMRPRLVTSPKHVGAVGGGGLSGPPLRARAVEIVRRVRARLGRSVVVIGVGGVERAEHVMALVQAGANLVQMYTGLIYEGPLAPAAIARDLARMVERAGVKAIGDLLSVERSASSPRSPQPSQSGQTP
jgi:dihydroorotate dehydrogenase